MPIILAILINEISHNKFKKFVQTISYLPHFLSWVVLGGIVIELLSPSRGVVNYFLALLGFEPIYFITEPSLFRGILIVTGIWATVGWGTIIYLAAITGIDRTQYEAAYIDGANRFQIISQIIIPSVMPVISIVFILGLGKLMNAGFDQVFNLYNPMVYSTGDIIDTYVYRVGLGQMQYSFSTAVNLFKNVIGLVLIIGVNMFIRKFGSKENALW
jgi:putative aldouronate transport system permease protein